MHKGCNVLPLDTNARMQKGKIHFIYRYFVMLWLSFKQGEPAIIKRGVKTRMNELLKWIDGQWNKAMSSITSKVFNKAREVVEHTGMKNKSKRHKQPLAVATNRECFRLVILL